MSSPPPGPRKYEDVVWLRAGRPFSPLVGATRTGREARGCGRVHRPEPAVVWRVPGKGKFSHFPARKKYLKVTKVAGVSKTNKQTKEQFRDTRFGQSRKRKPTDRNLIFCFSLPQTSSPRGGLHFTGGGSCESCLLKIPKFILCIQLGSQEDRTHCACLLFQVNHSMNN